MKQVKKLSDSDYWKQFKEHNKSRQNHDLNIDVSVKFRNGIEEIYSGQQKNINCNFDDLEIFFSNLKKTIRMLDETINKDEDEFE
jgi:hypothetical protein